MPLTFDSLTLVWLKTSVSLWLSRSGLALLLALLCGGSGCVPATRFEEAQSAAQVEMEGRRRVEYQVEQLQTQNTSLQAKLQQQATLIDERDDALAQAGLDTNTQGKQREDAEGLVEQLRGELSRVGDHLRSYQDDKQKLEASRVAEVARGRTMSLVARDAALVLAEPVTTGEYSLEVESGKVVLRVPRDQLIGSDGAVKLEADPLLKSFVRILTLHPLLRVAVKDPSAAASASAGVASALVDRGVDKQRLLPLESGAAAALPGVSDASTPALTALDAAATRPEVELELIVP